MLLYVFEKEKKNRVKVDKKIILGKRESYC